MTQKGFSPSLAGSRATKKGYIFAKTRIGQSERRQTRAMVGGIRKVINAFFCIVC